MSEALLVAGARLTDVWALVIANDHIFGLGGIASAAVIANDPRGDRQPIGTEIPIPPRVSPP
jgi:hypothetical protein